MRGVETIAGQGGNEGCGADLSFVKFASLPLHKANKNAPLLSGARHEFFVEVRGFEPLSKHIP